MKNCFVFLILPIPISLNSLLMVEVSLRAELVALRAQVVR